MPEKFWRESWTGKNQSARRERNRRKLRLEKLIKMNTEEIEAELESEFGDVGIDIEGNLIILEKCKLCVCDLNVCWRP